MKTVQLASRNGIKLEVNRYEEQENILPAHRTKTCPMKKKKKKNIEWQET